jgi:hypothetical protein
VTPPPADFDSDSEDVEDIFGFGFVSKKSQDLMENESESDHYIASQEIPIRCPKESFPPNPPKSVPPTPPKSYPPKPNPQNSSKYAERESEKMATRKDGEFASHPTVTQSLLISGFIQINKSQLCEI